MGLARTRTSSSSLTERELLVLQAAADGNTGKETALLLGVHRETIKTQRRSLYKKLEAHNIQHAVAIALREGLIK